MVYIIKENERGFLFKEGVFERMLMPGKYTFWNSSSFAKGHSEVRRVPLTNPLTKAFTPAELAVLRKDPEFAAQTVTQEVPDGFIAVHRVDGLLSEVLPAGKYLFWNQAEKHSFELYDTTQPDVPEELSTMLCDKLRAKGFMKSFEVGESQVGLLLENGRFVRILAPGRYYFWNNAVNINVRIAETRWQELSLNGQEILTKDRVGVRLNFVCSYRVTDCLAAFREIEDYETQFYTAVQLAVREHVAGLVLDELLQQRDVIGEELLQKIRPKAEALFIEVKEAGIRDIILPGDVRDIMNTVLLAEKRAQANVITRREEVASTRSLLNTAKLMDENKTLYKLKELEYLERICENVGNLSVSGGDLLENLRELLRTKPE